MKLVVVLLVVLGVAVVTAGSCSINHRSGDFTCATQAECRTGLVCSDGFCVLPGDPGVKPDAQPIGDANSCPAQCTSCNAGTKSCTIDCMLNNGACNQAITCPTGWDCNILCSTTNACRNGVNCLNSRSCTIACSGAQSCRNISCGSGPCNIGCTGTGSCRSLTCGSGPCQVNCNTTDSCQNVSCGLSCACDVTCNSSPCLGLTCKTPQCRSPTPLIGCTSRTSGCNTCP